MTNKYEQRVARDMAKMNEKIANAFDTAAVACDRHGAQQHLRIMAAKYRNAPIANDPGIDFKHPPSPEAVLVAEATLDQASRNYGLLKGELLSIAFIKAREQVKFALKHPVHAVRVAVSALKG